MMEYKGYVGRVEYDDEAGLFHGEVVNTRDVVTFQGETVKELRKAFRESIEDYLSFCAERGEAPDKPLSGQFVTRISPELHRAINRAAAASGVSLNAWVAQQLERAVVRPAVRRRAKRNGKTRRTAQLTRTASQQRR